MKSFVRISALLWADVLVAYALFVMQNYLTEVWKLSLTHAAGILNIWNGIAMILPVVFLFFRDVLLGNCGVLIISSISYSTGIGFVTMSIPSVLGKPCKQLKQECIGQNQEALFYTGMVLIAVGMAGNLTSLPAFLDEQGDRSDDENSLLCGLKILSFPTVVIVPVVGGIALPYIKPWRIRFGIPAICTAVGTVSFLTGVFRICSQYTIGRPSGSPVTNICRVFVAFIFKMGERHPLDDNLFHNKDGEDTKFTQTRCLRCLEKAAIIHEGISREEQENNRWKLCTVAEVEEAKIAVRMVPMWLTFIICGVVSSFGNTYFVEQGKKLNRRIGKWNVPLPALLMFFKSMKDLFGGLADQHVLKFKTCGPSVGIGISMVFSILCCITAAKTEQRRLNVVRKHNLLDKPEDNIPMSIYWLLFQFLLLAGLDSFFEKSVAAFYKIQAPDSMKKYMEYLTRAVFGLGYMANVLTVYVVGKVSEKGGKQNWFQFTLNKSRLDRYYWVLAGISFANLVLYAVVASCYRYRNREVGNENRDGLDVGGVEMGEPEHRQCCAIFGL